MCLLFSNGMQAISFEGFEGREESLKTILRYNVPRRTPMWYRTNLFLHSHRVFLIVRELLTRAVPIYGSALDPAKALTLALVHDDAEIVTGDHQLDDKEKWTKAQHEENHRKELAAIEELAARWPSQINGYEYRLLLTHALTKDCLEAQIVSLADKIDGFCESVHEVVAGNALFEEPVSLYPDRLNAFPKRFSKLRYLIPSAHPFLRLVQPLPVSALLSRGSPHTIGSVHLQTDSPHYEKWKQLSIAYIGRSCLVDRKE
ncbi:HD domain-containing protein [Candidatus Woesearchaeota archaeon]|nr:HD domain-containing protein [Candidatus Woesearchaeota archaeon]